MLRLTTGQCSCPRLSAGEKSALLDEMLGANPATRALLMPEQVSSPEMRAVERRLGWLPATLNVAAALLNYLADRMEMTHSIEGRVPFLDHHVAEVSARGPVNIKVKGIREKHVLREAAKDVLIPAVYDRQKHPFTTPPTRSTNDPMLTFYRDTFASYRDTFASQAAKAQRLFDTKKVATALDQLLECPDDQRIAVEGGLQHVARVIVMRQLSSVA